MQSWCILNPTSITLILFVAHLLTSDSVFFKTSIKIFLLSVFLNFSIKLRVFGWCSQELSLKSYA